LFLPAELANNSKEIEMEHTKSICVE
jgi:hypothetical protein